MNAVKGIENKKWDFSKQEEAAVSWLLERGFEVKLEKQYTSKDVYTVAKDGVSDEFTFPEWAEEYECPHLYGKVW
jgi:hypothetical protein